MTRLGAVPADRRLCPTEVTLSRMLPQQEDAEPADFVFLAGDPCLDFLNTRPIVKGRRPSCSTVSRTSCAG